eukprot:g47836.t1
MFYADILKENRRQQMDIREAASLRQQRRMKQAVQFIHKDSADLLPLDGLKKLGTSKETEVKGNSDARVHRSQLPKMYLGFRAAAPWLLIQHDARTSVPRVNGTGNGSKGVKAVTSAIPISDSEVSSILDGERKPT